MDKLTEFSNINLFTVILLAISLFFMFRFFTWFLPLIILKKEKRKQAWRYTALLELAVWLSFMIWSVNYLSNSNGIYAIGAFILLFTFTFYTGWVALKDFIAGAFFRTNHNLSVNEIIKIGEYSGKIIKFTPSMLILETDIGESILLPYSYLLGKVILKSNPAESILSYTFRFEISAHLAVPETLQQIRAAILNMPWASLRKQPQTKPIADTQLGHLIEVTVFSIEKEYFYEMEKQVKEKFGMETKAEKIIAPR